MDILDSLKLATSTMILGIAAGTFLVIWGVKQTKIDNKWLPLLSMGIGLIIGALVALFVYHGNPAMGAFEGFIAGGLASGGYDALKPLLKNKEEK